MARRQTSASRDNGHPVYELRARGIGRGEIELEIWQLPSPATPRLAEPERTARLEGRALRLIEPKVLKRLHVAKVKLGSPHKGEVEAHPLDEDLALNLALMFRVLAPMRSIDRIRAVADAVDQMSQEEAGYWLGMAVHRKHPRRVLAALRTLLTMP